MLNDQVTVSHIDYTVVMKVLNENLSEGKDDLTIPNEEINNTQQNKPNGKF